MIITIDGYEVEVSCPFCGRKITVTKLGDCFHCSQCATEEDSSGLFDCIFDCQYCLNDKYRKRKCVNCNGVGKTPKAHFSTRDTRVFE